MTKASTLSWLGPYGFSMGSQGLSSVTNLVLNLQLARTLSAHDFGAFSVVYALLLLFAVGARALMAEPYAVRLADGIRPPRRDIDQRTLGMTTTIGIAAALLVAAISRATVPITFAGGVIIAFAAGVIVHDVARGMLLGQRRARAAFATDAAWAVVQASIIVAGVLAGFSSVSTALVAWAAGAVGALVLSCIFLRSAPLPTLKFKDSGHPFHCGIPWAVDYVAAAGVLSILVVLLGVLVSLQEVAALRGALVLMGPSTVLVGGIRNLALPRLANAVNPNVRAASRRLGAVMVLVVAGTTVPLLFVSEDLGRAMLGESWAPARAVLPLIIIQRCGAAAANGFSIGLRVVKSTTLTAAARLVITALSIGAGVVGALLAGAMGAAAGIMVVTLAAIMVWDRLLGSTLEPVSAPDEL